jgi:large repetitive protein
VTPTYRFPVTPTHRLSYLPSLALVLLVGCGGDEVRTVSDGKKPDGGTPVTDSGPAEKIRVCRTLDPLPSGTCKVEPGGASKLLTGTILTPEHLFRGGEMLVTDAGVISCVGCDCSAGATGATRIRCPNGVISPGLVNAHDHLTFAQNSPYTDTGERYEQRHDWRRGLRGHTQITSAGDGTASQIQWGELRFVMGGATSTAGSGSASGFLRNLDTADQEGLTNRPVQIAAFPLDDADGTQRNGDCDYGTNADTQAGIAAEDAYEPHVAEGIDAIARNEFLCTSTSTFDTTAPGVSNDLLGPKSAFIHAVGLRASDYRLMATEGAALVWSPRSNLALYGDTAAVTVAARAGVRIALGTDWIVSGSMNLLRELHCADTFNGDYLGGFFSDEDLWKMVTVNASSALARTDTLGVLAPGHVADIAIFDGASRPEYRAIIDAGPADVALVLRGGKTLYGDSDVVGALPNGTCDVVDVCGREKRICAEAETGLAYDALRTAAGDPYPAFACGTPTNEPSCTPSRSASVSSSTIYSGAKTADDEDGDGIPSAADDCPAVFNPARPVDDGVQADADGDGAGDACDPCPLEAGSTSCVARDR